MASDFYNTALMELKRKKNVKVGKGHWDLGYLSAAQAVILSAKRLYPDTYAEYLGKHLPENLNDLGPKITDRKMLDETGAVLENMLPIMMEMNEDSFVFEIFGPFMSGEEYYEICEDESLLESYSNPQGSFPMFIWSIYNGIGGDEWEYLNEHLCWHIPKPPRRIMGIDIDDELLERNLVEAGIGPVMVAIRVVWRDTGNYLWDADPFDYGGEREITVNNICKVVTAFKDSAALEEAYDEALNLIGSDPEIYRKVAQALAASLEV